MEEGRSNSGSKDYLVSLMFSHYDLNNNGLLEFEEFFDGLSLISTERISLNCKRN